MCSPYYVLSIARFPRQDGTHHVLRSTRRKITTFELTGRIMFRRSIQRWARVLCRAQVPQELMTYGSMRTHYTLRPIVNFSLKSSIETSYVPLQ